jgi:hypothetical protein
LSFARRDRRRTDAVASSVAARLARHSASGLSRTPRMEVAAEATLPEARRPAEVG